ncbi:hypothetical protein Y021_06645 [Streptococcus thermophilus 1F8CT]|nr:hypothetical protein Y021_06645 [Streptococcus thermophilus 1F8CT]
MRSSTASSISHEFKGLTEIRDEKFRQDTEGNCSWYVQSVAEIWLLGA